MSSFANFGGSRQYQTGSIFSRPDFRFSLSPLSRFVVLAGVALSAGQASYGQLSVILTHRRLHRNQWVSNLF